MKAIFFVATIAVLTCSAQQQQGAPGQAQAPSNGAQGQNRASQANDPNRPRELQSNDRMGIDIDRYVGNPFSSVAKVTHEVMLTRSILRAGDPHAPGDPGAVLEYRKDFALATLMPKNRTPLVELPVEQIFYVESGEGRLDDGSQYWDLHEGIAILIPPSASHRISNTSDKPLNMLMLSWESPAGVTPRKTILVRDVSMLPFAEKNAHWSYMAKNVFHPSDGLHPNEKVLVVYVSPMSMGAPHAHPPHWEEVWTNIGPGDSFMQIGSEIRDMPANTAMIAPPNGQTVHSVLNMTRDKVQAFFYFARYTTPAPSNFKDEASVTGKPLH